MIPPFDESGNLPPGLHRASLAEIRARFGQASELRQVQVESLTWMVEAARRAGALRIVVNGSFVTDIIEPNDVDCVLLFAPGRRRNRTATRELRQGLPFLDLKLVGQAEFDEYVNAIFGTDRDGAPKGMIEVIL